MELKALDKLPGREETQILHYRKASGMRIGLLINFGSHGRLEWKRLILWIQENNGGLKMISVDSVFSVDS